MLKEKINHLSSIIKNIYGAGLIVTILVLKDKKTIYEATLASTDEKIRGCHLFLIKPQKLDNRI